MPSPKTEPASPRAAGRLRPARPGRALAAPQHSPRARPRVVALVGLVVSGIAINQILPGYFAEQTQERIQTRAGLDAPPAPGDAAPRRGPAEHRRTCRSSATRSSCARRPVAAARCPTPRSHLRRRRSRSRSRRAAGHRRASRRRASAAIRTSPSVPSSSRPRSALPSGATSATVIDQRPVHHARGDAGPDPGGAHRRRHAGAGRLARDRAHRRAQPHGSDRPAAGRRRPRGAGPARRARDRVGRAGGRRARRSSSTSWPTGCRARCACSRPIGTGCASSSPT